MLTPLVSDRIWVAERPVRFGGVWLRSRTVVVRLEDGSLWVHSPDAPTPAMREALDALGPVRWLVVPNRFHHLQMPANAAAFPEARTIGPATALERNQGLRLDLRIDEPEVARAVPELEPLPLAGVPYLDETAFYHRPTQTLIGADLVLCAGHADHWSWRIPARLLGRYDQVKIPPDVRVLTPRREATARALQAMLERPFQQIAVAHADLISDAPHERLARAWRHVLQPGPVSRLLSR